MKIVPALPSGIKKIGIFGLGRSNLSLVQMLPRDAVYILRSDARIRRQDIPGWMRLGGTYEGDAALSDISEQVMLLSPSVRRDRPELAEATGRGVILTSDAELFFQQVDAPVLAVSGSSGKSTTATLAHLMLGGDEEGAALLGNVGVPMVAALGGDASLYVCELSSFMLQYHRATVRRSALTSVTENHLDWHRDFEEYKAAKLSLFALSSECVTNADDPILAEYGRHRHVYGAVSVRCSLGELVARQRADIYMTYEDGWLTKNGERIIHVTELQRREIYNIKNMLCAMALTEGFTDRERTLSALRSFQGLEHRAKLVCEARGVRYIDSSIDTSPERCAETLRGLGERVVLLLGGRGKGLSYGPIVEPVSRFVRCVVAFGEERERIREALCGAVPVAVREGFRDAVAHACQVARSGECVLLSPACTSYDEFTSFEERGRAFAETVRGTCSKKDNKEI